MADTAPTSPGGISPKIPVESEKPTGLGNQPTSFEKYMQGTAGNTTAGTPSATGTQGPQGPSPVDLARPTVQTSAPTFDSLMTQARSTQDGLGTIGQQLKDPNLKLKRSQSQLLKHKLQDANGHIRAAGERIGVQEPPARTVDTKSPLAHFLGMIGKGEDNMAAVQSKIKEMSDSTGEIQPADMLYMQVKMGQAQQEVEYASTLLGKTLDAIKQTLNTQL